jgi:hypothetical protein
MYMREGFHPDVAKKIFNDVSKSLDTKLTSNEAFFDTTAKQSLQDSSFKKDVYKTGATQKSTRADVILDKTTKTIKFVTEGDLIGKEGYWYPKHPYEGIGTSEKYGPRPWLEIAAMKVSTAMGWRK